MTSKEKGAPPRTKSTELSNALLHLATTLNPSTFRALSPGLGLGQVHATSKRKRVAEPVPPRIIARPEVKVAPPTAARATPTPAAAPVVKPKASAKLRRSWYKRILRVIGIHIGDLLLLGVSVLIALLSAYAVLEDRPLALQDAETLLFRWLGFFSLPELVLALYGGFVFYFVFFKLLTGQTPAQVLARRLES